MQVLKIRLLSREAIKGRLPRNFIVVSWIFTMVSAKIFGVFAFALVVACVSGRAATGTSEADAAKYLEETLPMIEEQLKSIFSLSFNFNGDVNDEESDMAEFLYALFVAAGSEEFLDEFNARLKTFPIENFEDKMLARQIHNLIEYDFAALPTVKKEQIEAIMEKFEEMPKTVEICRYESQTKCQHLDENFDWKSFLFQLSNIDEIRYYWQEWRNKVGKPFRKDFKRFVKLYREAARLNNFQNASSMWFQHFEDDHVLDEIQEALMLLGPLYKQMHAHVRHQAEKYFHIDLGQKPIPDDILEKIVLQASKPHGGIPYPFQDAPVFNLREELVAKHYSPIKMIQDAEKFFQSMHMAELPSDFYSKNVQLKSNTSDCFASSVGFYIRNEIGFRYCDDITFRNYLATHRELAEIQYQLYTADLPLPLRRIDWPGFSQGVAYAVLASVASPTHLKHEGFLENFELTEEANINRLYRIALQIFFKIPTNYVLDKFRADALDKKIDDDDYNCEFWKYRERYVGVQPPVTRTEQEFDALIELPHGIDSIRTKNIFSKILGFQLYEGLCNKAGYHGQLDNCDFSQGSGDAADALKEMMSLGSSKHWREVMKVVTGTDKLNGQSFFNYFQPLYNWLKSHNEANNIPVDWESVTQCFKGESVESEED